MQVREREDVKVPKIRFEAEKARTYARMRGWDTDNAAALAMGVNPGNYSRVVRGVVAPGEKFIAAALTTYGPFGVKFEHLFTIIADGEPRADEQAAA